jgi:hypothetical protein
MTTQTILDDRRSAGSSLGIQLAMTAISMAVVGAFVLWHAWPEGGQRSESTAEDVTMSAATDETRLRDGRADPYAYQEATARPAYDWLYIVDSEAQAQLIFEFQQLVTENVGRPAPSSSNVIWFDSEESEARFWKIHGEDDAVREHYGLPRQTVVDLRGPATYAAPLADLQGAN